MAPLIHKSRCSVINLNNLGVAHLKKGGEKLFFITDKHVAGMALLRIISGIIEFSAAMLMLKLNKVDQAMKINALLAVIGPTVLILVTAIGIAGLAGKISFSKMMFVILGVGFIFYGVQK